MIAEKFLPKLPELNFLGDDVSYGYDASDMREYALEAVNAVLATQADAPEAGQEAAAVQAVMSEQQIRHWWASENGLEDCDMCKVDDFRKVVRAVEEKLAALSGSLGDGGGTDE